MSTPSTEAWDFSCLDWLQKLQRGETPIPELSLNERRAATALAMFNKLRLPDVPERPMLRDAAGEWTRDIVRCVFGSLDDDGVRRVAELFCLVPKKNSKTTSGAAIMVTALMMNIRPRAEFLLVGPTQEIADIAFEQASGMVEADEYLMKRFRIQEHIKTIKDLKTKAKLKIKTFDLKVMTGAKPAGVLLDEMHIMSNMSFAARVVGQIRGGLLPNPEAFLIIITTQSDDVPAGVFKSELQYARGVRDGRIKNGRMLPILYEFSEEQQTDESKPWRDPKNWAQVLPNLNRSITLDRLVADYQTAMEKGEEEERRWASQHLNVEIGLALHANRWRGADHWLGATEKDLTLEELLARSDVVTVGIDGGGLDDLLGFAVIGRDRETRRWLLWNKAWCQRDVLTLRKEIAPKLEDLARTGDLAIVDDGTSDIEELVDYCEAINRAGLFPEQHGIGIDPYAVSALIDELARREPAMKDPLVIAIRQGTALSPASWGMERKLKDRTITHCGQQLMAWCVGNARQEQRGNAVYITKQASGKAKIDPLVATFNAATLMARNPDGGTGRSFWDN